MRPTFPRSFRPPTARPLPTISNNLPTVHDLPVNQVHPANKHHVTYKRSYPSGPRLEQLRLKYPYMSAQTLADSICTHAGEMKGAVIFRQLREAMGKCGTSKFARPITGMQIKLNGVTHTELVSPTFPPSFAAFVSSRKDRVVSFQSDQGSNKRSCSSIVGTVVAAEHDDQLPSRQHQQRLPGGQADDPGPQGRCQDLSGQDVLHPDAILDTL
jgi:hypothetical protein